MLSFFVSNGEILHEKYRSGKPFHALASSNLVKLEENFQRLQNRGEQGAIIPVIIHIVPNMLPQLTHFFRIE